MSTDDYSDYEEDVTDSSQEDESVVCGVCLAEKLEIPVKLPCAHIFCFTCIKPWLETSRGNCPLCQRPVGEDAGKLKIVQDLMDKMTVPEEKNCPFRWQYAGRNYGFWDYSPSINLEIEHKYQEYLSAISNRQYPADSESDGSESGSSESESGSSESDSDESKSSESDSKSDNDQPVQVQTSAQTEMDRIKSLQTCRVEIGPTVYMINFESMTQYPENMPGRTRAIQRMDKGLLTAQNCKGTAGLEKVIV